MSYIYEGSKIHYLLSLLTVQAILTVELLFICLFEMKRLCCGSFFYTFSIDSRCFKPYKWNMELNLPVRFVQLSCSLKRFAVSYMLT